MSHSSDPSNSDSYGSEAYGSDPYGNDPHGSEARDSEARGSEARGSEAHSSAAPTGASPASDSPSRPRRVLIPVLVAVVLIAVVAVGIGYQMSRDTTDGVPQAAPTVAGSSGDQGVTFGEAGPLVEVFVDYQCPHCSELEGVIGAELNSLVSAGDAQVTIRPVKFLSRSSGRGAAALHCAADSGRAMLLHEAMLADISADFSPDGLTELAGGIGIDEDAFAACMADRATAEWVNQVSDAAREEGIAGIPLVRVDGTQLTEDQLATGAAFRAAVTDAA